MSRIIRYFTFLIIICFKDFCFIKCSAPSCPSMRQQLIFVYAENKRSVSTSQKLEIKGAATQNYSEVECVRRFECHSYDYFAGQHLCELNLNEGDNRVEEK